MMSGNTLRMLRPWLSLGLVTMVAALAVSQPAPTSPPDSGGMSAFGKMIPLGVVNTNVRVPAFENGKPSSLLTAATLTRLDDERLSAEKVVVEIYGDTPAETLNVDLKSAVYHMKDQILRSGERSRVSRSDFQMEGDTMIFDSANSIGSMKGRVRTLIFDTGAVSGKSEDNQPSN